MADMDLIPPGYRNWLSRRRLVMRFAVSLASVCVVVLMAGFVLQRSTNQITEHVAQLRKQHAVTEMQGDQLQQLIDQKSEYERRWSLLRGLRAGAAVDDIFSLIDRSIDPGELWFLDWSFRRAGVLINGERRGIETGYFVLVDETGRKPTENNLSVETHMTIHGQAKDHQALSKFVRTLFEEPDIKDVDVSKTSRTSYANGRVVDFSVTVVLNSAFKEA